MERRITLFRSRITRELVIHEAGHIVAAYMMRIPVRRVRLGKNRHPKSAGFTRLLITENNAIEYLERDIFTTLAGNAAEITYLRPKRSWLVDSDSRRVVYYLTHIYYNEDWYQELSEEECKSFIKDEVRYRRRITLWLLKQREPYEAVKYLTRRLINRQNVHRGELTTWLKQLKIRPQMRRLLRWCKE